jgi:hypothetical protein
MTLLVAWLVFPVVLAALCVGCGLLLDALAAGGIPGPLVPPTGLAVIIVVAQVPTLWAATAAGFATARRWRAPATIVWPLVAAMAVFAVYAAPIVLSGQATFAGYIRLDDTATWMGLTDRVMDHGRSLAGLPPSTYEATLAFNLGAGYPIGVFLPLGIARVLVGQDLAWIIQPYLAFCASLLALALWQLAEPVVRSRALRAAVAFVAAQSALLFGYYLWGGIKEAAGAALVATIAALAPLAVRERFASRSLAPLAVTCAALIGVLSGGGAIWLMALLAPLAMVAVLRLGVIPGLARVGLFAAATAAFCVPVLAPGGALPPTSSPLTSSSALGNLGHPLSKLQLFGIWPAGDFRLDPADPALAYTLIGVAGAAALLGLYWAWQRRAWAPPLYSLGALAACGVIVAAGSPWVEAKAMAIAAPAIVLLAMVGGGSLLSGAAPALRARVPLLIVGLGLLVAVAGGVLWSNALAYRDVNLAPRDQLAELETIGGRIAGEGPTLMTEYQPYGVRHFLRDAAPEGASELRRRVVPLKGGGSLHKGQSADTDRFRLGAILTYRTLVLRRSPFQSRPPAPYRLIWRGRYYEVWQRPPSVPRAMLAHLGLGRGVQPGSVPRCSQVHRLARKAGKGGSLLAAARERSETIRPGATMHPAAWEWTGYPTSLLPTTPGTMRAVARVTRPDEYEIWLGGSVRPQVDLEVDGQPAGEVRHQLNNEGEFVLLGRARLARGAHTLTVTFRGADLHPGSGGSPNPIGPLVLSRQDPASEPVVRFDPSNAARLCGKRWDWIEALRR